MEQKPHRIRNQSLSESRITGELALSSKELFEKALFDSLFLS